jgi:iron complex transport system ATP-binding protein
MDTFTVDNISFGYDPALPVVRDVSLNVSAGEFLTLVGPNGSGKSTLLRLLDRIHAPQRGAILLSDQPLARLSRSAIARRIGYVPQDNSVQFPFSVADIVLMGRSPHTRGSAFENSHDRTVANTMMHLMDVAHLAGHLVTDLSGGERQRVFIARALAQQPEILLLDEPNAHLDIAHQLEVFRIIRKLNTESGLTVISVSHDLNLASSFSDTIAMMVDGRLAATGSPEAVLTEEQIEGAFGTPVIVDTHPVRRTPRVSLPG